MLLLGLSAAAEGQDNSPASGSAVFEQFKDFIAHPPPIADVVFSYRGPPVLYRKPGSDQVLKRSADMEFVRARWDSGRALVVSMSALTDLAAEPLSDQFAWTHGTVLIRDGEDLWNIVGTSKTAISWRGKLDYPYDSHNPAVSAWFRRGSPLFSFVSMGPHFMPPATIRWSGNRFEQMTKIPEGEFLIEGELFASRNGFPEKMSFRIRSATGDGQYLARYSYGTNSAGMPPFIPEHIQTIVYHGAEEYPDKDLRIFSMRLGAPPAQPSANVVSWVRQRALSEFVHTNHTLYAVGAAGQLRPVPVASLNWRPPVAMAHANRYYYVSCGPLFVGFLTLASRMRKQTKQQHLIKGTA